MSYIKIDKSNLKYSDLFILFMSKFICKTPCNPRGIPKRYEFGIPLGYTSWVTFIPLGLHIGMHPKRYGATQEVWTQMCDPRGMSCIPRGMACNPRGIPKRYVMQPKRYDM